MAYAEQIAAFEAKHAANVATLKSLADKAGDAGETFDAEAQDQFDELTAENEAVEKHLSRLRALEKMAGATAKPVDGGSEKAAGESRDPRVPAQVKAAERLDPGIAVARIARAKAVATVKGMTQREAAASLYGEASSTYGYFAKAAVAPAMTTNDAWAGNLVGDETSVFADFVEYLRPQTILGRFGANGVPSLRNVGFRVPLIGQTSGGAGYWVGEGQAKPLTKFDFSRTTLEPLKVANIAVASKEVLDYSNPSADAIIRDSLVDALRERLDIDFIDPSKTAVAGVSPASITNAATPIPSTGNTADDVRADIRALFGAFIAANNAPTSGVWIMSATTALALSLMQNPLGQSEFPGISMTGGTLFGLPVIVSEHVPTVTGSVDPDDDGAYVVLVNSQDIYLGDEGGFSVDFSREASLQMDTAPDNPTTAATVLVSLWQRNLVGFLAERTINWAARRPSSVQVLSAVNWG
ncbi:MAG TPA: phage major capsid protein [Paracoccus sp.]|nr:phage major capsid protein [Paracoccus sp. (in: a-proteobacteria)]